MPSRKTSQRIGERPVTLLGRVVQGDPDAWRLFVENYCGFLYALAWRYARGDVDMASELVLVALEGLKRPDADGRPYYRLRKYLDSLKRFGKRGRFVTWLALVARNLFRDWFRESGGRRVMPKEIKGLKPMEQVVFKLIFWEGYLEHEACQKLRIEQGLDEAEFSAIVGRLYRRLTDRHFHAIYHELLRRVPALGTTRRFPGEGERVVEIPDGRPASRPDLAIEMEEARLAAFRVGGVLRQAVEELPPRTRNVVLLLWVQNLSGEEICRVMGFRKRQRVYDEMAKAKRNILFSLKKAGVEAELIHQAEGFLDGWLAEKDGEKTGTGDQIPRGMPS